MKQPTTQAAATLEAPALLVEGLSVNFGPRRVFDGLSFEVRPGEVVALIGPNGAGKSTVLQVVAGFHRAAGGSVVFGGRDVTELPPHRRARLGMSYFMQGGRIFHSLTVEENIEMGAALLTEPERKENIQVVLSIFPHLIGLSRVRGALLSGGERQALALAVVLVRRPSLLLLDEPSAGLAPAVTRHLLEKLHEILQHWRIGVLLVEQKIREAVGFSDRVIALANGRQVDISGETPEKLLASRRLHEIFFEPNSVEP